MVRMFRGRCPKCFRVTPVTKEQWYKPFKCSWCGAMFVPFTYENRDPNLNDTYEHMGITKSIEKSGGKVKFMPRRIAPWNR